MIDPQLVVPDPATDGDETAATAVGLDDDPWQSASLAPGAVTADRSGRRRRSADLRAACLCY